MTLAGSPLIKQLEEQFPTPEQFLSLCSVDIWGQVVGGSGGVRGRPVLCCALQKAQQPDLHAPGCQYHPSCSHNCPQTRPRRQSRPVENPALQTALQGPPLRPALRGLLPSALRSTPPPPCSGAPKAQAPLPTPVPQASKSFRIILLTITITATAFFQGIYSASKKPQRAFHGIEGKNVTNTQTRRTGYSLH